MGNNYSIGKTPFRARPRSEAQMSTLLRFLCDLGGESITRADNAEASPEFPGQLKPALTNVLS